MSGAALAEAAVEFAGARFLLHGRDPATGLDCIGLVGAALQKIGREPVLPANYTLRNLDAGRFLAFAAGNGFEEASSRRAGDVVLFRLSRVQLHLAVYLGGGNIVHAHAGLRRVVAGPCASAWHQERCWRLGPATAQATGR